MNTDMNQYLTFWYTSTVVRKMTAYLLCCAGLACSPFVLTEHISSKYIYAHGTGRKFNVGSHGAKRVKKYIF